MLKADEIGSPMTGGEPKANETAILPRGVHTVRFARADFTVADDISAIAPIVVSIANRFAEYEASGSTAWEATMDVRQRPDWIVRAQTKVFEPKKVHRLSFDPTLSVFEEGGSEEEEEDQATEVDRDGPVMVYVNISGASTAADDAAMAAADADTAQLLKPAALRVDNTSDSHDGAMPSCSSAFCQPDSSCAAAVVSL